MLSAWKNLKNGLKTALAFDSCKWNNPLPIYHVAQGLFMPMRRSLMRPEIVRLVQHTNKERK